jgi:hypothetical protein
MKARVPQCSVLYPTLCNLYINDTPQTIVVYLALFSGDTRLYATECKEGYVFKNLQCGLNSVVAWCKCWNIINEEETAAIYFYRSRPPESLLTVIGKNISFISSVIYLGVIFDKRITWRLHIETVETKPFRIFIRLYSLLKSDRLSTNSKLTIHKALIRSVMTCVCPAWEFAEDTLLIKL